MNDTVSDIRIVRRARFQPLSAAGRSVLPSRIASRSRSKYTMNESAVMPIATTRPAEAPVVREQVDRHQRQPDDPRYQARHQRAVAELGGDGGLGQRLEVQRER